MYKYKDLEVNDKVKIVKSADPFTKNITIELLGSFGIITKIDISASILMGYLVQIDKLNAALFLQRDALEFYGRSTPFDPIDRILPDGTVIEAGIAGYPDEDNKSVIHKFGHISYWPMCGARSGQEYYDVPLNLAPKITCQKCLSIMYHKRRTILEEYKYINK